MANFTIIEPTPPPPQFQIDSAEPRAPGVWVALSAVFFALISLQLISSFLKPPEQAGASQLIPEIKQRIKWRAMMGSLPEAYHTSAILIPESITIARKTDPLAAKVYAAARYEQGIPVTEADLSVLKDSPDRENGALIEIYTSSKLDPTRARELVSALPKGKFIDTAASVAALEKAGVPNAAAGQLGKDSVIEGYLVGAALLLAVGLGGVFCIAYLSLRTSRSLLAAGLPAGNLTDGRAELFVVRALQLLLIFVALDIGVGFVGAQLRLSDIVRGVAAQFVVVFAMVGVSKLAIMGRVVSLRSIGWRTQNLRRDILWGLGGAIANAPIVLVLGLLGRFLFGFLPAPPHPLALKLENDHEILTWIVGATSASILAPIFEETLFRGLLMPAMAQKFRSLPTAIIVSSLLFGAIHPTGPQSWLALAGIGATSCILAHQTGSLVPSVVMHSVHNLATLVLLVAFS